VAADRQNFDIVFDASNAMAHTAHCKQLEALGALVIDLTPSRIGHMIAPTVNGTDAFVHRNVSLISCGGQDVNSDPACAHAAVLTQLHRSGYHCG
jgi:acetaldehyde dehydrogenase